MQKFAISALLLTFLIQSNAQDCQDPSHHCPPTAQGYTFDAAFYLPLDIRQQITPQISCNYHKNPDGSYIVYLTQLYCMPVPGGLWKPDQLPPGAQHCISPNHDPLDCPFMQYSGQTSNSP